LNEGSFDFQVVQRADPISLQNRGNRQHSTRPSDSVVHQRAR